MTAQLSKIHSMPRKKLRLILASRSPRRREILKEAHMACTVFSSNSSELFDENLTIDANLKAVAETKVMAVLKMISPEKQRGILLLGADTVVIVGQKVLGKPKNLNDAMHMLENLSGKRHLVKTAFTLYCPDKKKKITRLVTTSVGFRKLSKADIEWYLFTGEPFDKAGGYGIQGLAQHFVNFVDGDFLNVVGLPLNAVREELRKHGWDVGTVGRSRQFKKGARKNRSGRKKSR
jgi:septum formation protein